VGNLEKLAKDSWVEMTEIVLPQHTNAIGSVFGGTVMAWVDTAAAVCALRHCAKQVVTASVDALHFMAPIKLGWIVTIRASINYTSNRSCEVGVKVTAMDPLVGDSVHTASAYLTMVGLDKSGKPTSIPALRPANSVEKRRWHAAEKRREGRLKLKQELFLRKHNHSDT